MARAALPLSALLLLALLAGCTGSTSTTTATGTLPPTPAATYALDCGLSNWNETCLVRASPNDSPSKAEIDVAVNPADPDNVFVASKDLDRKASDCVWAVGQYTKDKGRHWNTTYVAGPVAERSPTSPLYGWHCITDPILQYEPDGTLHYSLQAYKYNPADLPYVQDPVLGSSIPPEMGYMFHAISHDGGATFPTIFIQHAGDETALFHDYMRMGHNPVTGTVFTIWNQLSPGVGSIPVLVAVKHGQSVSQPPYYFPNLANAQDPTGQGISLGESSVVGASDGTVYAWLSGFNSGDLAVLATSTDDGATFSQPRQVWTFTSMDDFNNTHFRTGTSVELAVDTSGGARAGCLYAVWGGKEANTVGQSDVYVRTSCDKGVTWTSPVLVNTLHREDGQFMARASVDGRGTVHAVYLTRAYDPGHRLLDAEHAYSTDGGKSWAQERLTMQSFDGDLGIHQDGFPFIGDYIGISSVGDDTWMGFPDTLTGASEIAVAHSVYHG
ncbi:MAG: hypothetical protein QOI63_1017 [Thermoplasmata archaeon]|jgi:hypothetical protein|nr:hypothetical protein [Thermoplasmata archaeon]